MRSPRTPRHRLAFTLVELLVVVAIIGVLAAILLPVLAKAPVRADRIHCVNNLRQIGIAFHTWSRDHDGALPMAVSTNDGGSLEWHQRAANLGGVVFFSPRDFQVMSNALETPRLLVCRADRRRAAARDFGQVDLTRVSYFTGGDAALADPQSVLAGDGNLTNSLGAGVPLSATSPLTFRWSPERHEERGNVLFADGHVDLALTLGFRRVPGQPPFSGGAPTPGAPGGGSTGNYAPARDPRQTPSSVAPEISPGNPGGAGASSGASRSGSTRTRVATVLNAPSEATGDDPARPDGKPVSTTGDGPGVKTGAGDDPARPAWDTDLFRAVLGYAKAGYLLLVLLALLMLLIWLLRERLRRRADASTNVVDAE